MPRTLRLVLNIALFCELSAAFGCAGGANSVHDKLDASQAGEKAGTNSSAAGRSAQAGKGGSSSQLADAGRAQPTSDASTSRSDASTHLLDAGTSKSDAGAAKSDAGAAAVPTKAGNPDGKCSQALPAEAKAVDSSQPTTVVGSGDASSCSFDKLASAVKQGGVITFDCGGAAATIVVTSTLELPTDRNTVIDGGNKITLDGGGSVRIMEWNSGDWQKNTHTLTLQHLTLANGKATPTEMIPMRPDPCSQGYNDGEGGALKMRDGSLRAIDVVFANNQAAPLGPDTGGGAVYLLGCMPAYVASCTFSNNKASNAGAIGSLFATDFIYDSLFEGNSAIGHGANNNDPSMCSYMNNGQNEIGSGGNGGAIYSDGVAMDVTICGVEVRDNMAGAFGAAVFFTSNDQSNKGTLTIRDSKMTNNIPANLYWEWKPGISTNANTPDPINSDITR